MTFAPSDLLAFRRTVMSLTGITSASDVGIVGDGAHQHTGGYHEGMDVLETLTIGYDPPATEHIGSSTQDYSCRLARDRRGLTNAASAMDIGAGWFRGGRAAWIRFNNLFVAALHANDPALAAVRATNYSPDGTAKRRTDRQAGWSVVSSSDTVDTHTHVEWYRDTEGTSARQASLNRMAILIQQAIEGNDMSAVDNTDPSYQDLIFNVRALLAGEPTSGGPSHVANAVRASLTAILSQAQSNGSGISELKTALAGLQLPAAGGLSDGDRAAIAALTEAVNALNSRLATP